MNGIPHGNTLGINTHRLRVIYRNFVNHQTFQMSAFNIRCGLQVCNKTTKNNSFAKLTNKQFLYMNQAIRISTMRTSANYTRFDLKTDHNCVSTYRDYTMGKTLQFRRSATLSFFRAESKQTIKRLISSSWINNRANLQLKDKVIIQCRYAINITQCVSSNCWLYNCLKTIYKSVPKVKQ